MSDEDQPVTSSTTTLLWEVCRRQPDVAAIREAANGDLQPRTLAAAALTNRIGPLLWRAMTIAGCQDALGDHRSRVEEIYNLYRMQAMLLHPQAVALALEPLADIGLEPVVLKGLSVSRRYPDTGLRPMDDIDLLLTRESHMEAVGALTDAGWTVSRAAGRDHYDTQLRHPDVPEMPLELHYGLEAWHERSNRLDPKWLWQQRVPFDCLGTPAYSLPLEIEVVALAAHAGKPYHGFDRMIWLADLAMVIGEAEESDGIDWNKVARVAKTHQCVTVVNVALRMATRMGLSLPEGRFALPKSGWRSVPLQRLMEIDWPVAHDQGTFHIRFALVDSWWRRMALMGAAPYHSSRSERLHLPGRAAARMVDVWRQSRSVRTYRASS